MIILGVSCAHDSNICVLKDGEVILHVEKERLTRVRYDVGSMEEFVPDLLKSVGLSLDNIDLVATSVPVWKDMPTTGVVSGAGYDNSMGWGKGTIKLCGKEFPVYQFAHHLAHVAYAYYLSPFNEADVLSIDGGGNFTYGLFCKAKDTNIDLIADLDEQNLGWFWNALAARIFNSMDAAGKVMGLAPYGKPVYEDLLYEHYGFTDKYGNRIIRMKEFPDHTRPVGFPGIGYKNDSIKEPTQDEADMASSLQKITNDMIAGIIERHGQTDHSTNLCLSGGVVLNCVMNEHLRNKKWYKNIFVGSAPNDSGVSIGCALYLWHNILDNPRNASPHWHPYRGKPYQKEALNQAIEEAKKNKLHIYHFVDEEKQNDVLTELLIKQQVVGVHRGCAESGPRALGHRSILADPRNAEMKDIINKKVKFREAFRPFAPSVLIEYAREYLNFDAYSPYMSFAPVGKQIAIDNMPAIIHVDGSARLQTVDEQNNPDFYRLIKVFHKKTGIPGVLNTSLNTKGEPINDSPMNSMGTLLRSDLDALLIDDYLFTKKALNDDKS